MRIPLSKELLLDELKSNLERDFPGIKCTWRGSKVLVVSEPGVSKSAAAMVLSRKKNAIVNEGFSTMGGQFLFAISLVGLGILIPAIIYLIAFFPKQKAIRNKIGEYVRSNYSSLEVK
ncbi:MAG: hypothetical protein HYZ14_01070 [Bacteroidetes bacterium]|nr:hypothetical protein [Bacteroidota bacterium]